MLISLIGLPGSGKTTVGRQLARRLGCAFTDTDHEIEDFLGCSIRNYFAEVGEAKFRHLEGEMLGAVVAVRKGIVSTGGGIVLAAANRALLKSQTTCVYLRASPEELFKRLRHDQNRPLLQVADPMVKLRALHADRDPLYAATAQFTFDTGQVSLAMLVHNIAMQMELAGFVPAAQGDGSEANKNASTSRGVLQS